MGTQITGGRLTTISAQIVALLAADLGTTDLSATGRTAWGRFAVPPTIPFLAIDLDSVETDPAGPPLGYYRRIATFHFEGWYTITSDLPGSAMVFANLMASEVMAKIEDAHRDTGGGLTGTTYNIHDLWFTRYEHHETEINGRPYAHWTAKLILTYTVQRGL